jgi:DNA-binding transcriptional LysR family regulator
MAHLDWYIRANLKLRHLQLVVTLDELRNVGRVAAYLNVSQPAVSKTLSALERELNMSLFQRTARGMEPTEHGECLIRHARQILGNLSSARDELRDISEGRVTRVAMGALPSATVLLIPRFIVRLAAESTDVAVTVREGAMGSLLPSLRAGDLDLTVGILSESLGVEFESEVLYEDRIVAVARHAHPLTYERKLNWNMLAGYPMVLPSEHSLTRGPIDSYLAQHGVSTARRHVESVSTATNIGVLQFSDSVGFTAGEIARHFVSLGVLSVLPLNVSNLTMRVGLTWMANRRMTVAYQLVSRLFRETRDEMLPEMEAFARSLAR